MLVAAAALNAASADASTAAVAITGGGLTLASPSVRVVGENPRQLEVITSVTDARGTGAGWFLSLAATAPIGSTDQSLTVTGARSACEAGSACTAPDSDIPYPVPVSVNGARSWVFEAEPSSGLGAGDPTAASAPTPSAGLGPQLPPCSVREMTTTETCQTQP